MYKNKKVYIVSFADLYLSYTLKRMKKQAESFSLFDGYFFYDQNKLDPDFKDRFKNILNYKYRGFGYWCWKPQIILKTLETIEEGSILIYADSGCNLNIKGMEKLYKYFDIAIVNGLLTVEIDIKDRKFTKYDLFEYFNVLDNGDITDTNIRVATSIIMIKNDNNIKNGQRMDECFL